MNTYGYNIGDLKKKNDELNNIICNIYLLIQFNNNSHDNLKNQYIFVNNYTKLETDLSRAR